jgi:hypothetical protein
MGHTSTTGEGTGEIIVLHQSTFEAIKRESRELADRLAVALAELRLVASERDDLAQRLSVMGALCKPPPRRSTRG